MLLIDVECWSVRSRVKKKKKKGEKIFLEGGRGTLFKYSGEGDSV